MEKTADEQPHSLDPLWILLGVLLLGAVAILAYKAWPLLDPPLAQVAQIQPGCDLRQSPCLASFPGGGSLRLEIQPAGIPTAAPLRLRVETEGVQASALEVDFAGVDMYMGFNRVALREVGPGRYEGEGMIPVCVRARMTWEARVLAYVPDGIWAAPFRFDTLR